MKKAVCLAISIIIVLSINITGLGEDVFNNRVVPAFDNQAAESKYFISFTHWFDDGNTVLESVAQSNESYYQVDFNADKQPVKLTHYYNGDPSVEIYYGPNCIPQQYRMYKDGEPDGKWFYYQDTANLQVGYNEATGEVTIPPIDMVKPLKIEYYTEGELTHTIYYDYHDNGELAMEKNYSPSDSQGDENRDGYFRRYNRNGYLENEAYYINGISDQVWRQGEFNDQISILIWDEVTEYNQGIQNGLNVFTNEDGRRTEINYFEDGERVNYQIINYYENDPNQSYLNLPVESIKRYVNGKKHGNWEYFDSQSRLIKTESYVEGELSGYSYFYSYFDNIRQLERIEYNTPGSAAGEYMTMYFYYPDGTRMAEENYKSGFADGEFISYDPDGNILSLTEYAGGYPVRNGFYYDYFENGDCEVLHQHEYSRN